MCIVFIMRYRFIFLLFLINAFYLQVFAQQGSYIITKAPFSSKSYDEFSPVYSGDNLVFSSNRKSNSLVNYSSTNSDFNIVFIDTTGKLSGGNVKLLSKRLKTPFNDGPVTFSKGGDTIYFSRNLQVEGKIRDLSSLKNYLGIFSAVFNSRRWTDIKEFPYNNKWTNIGYNVTTPCLSPDGSRLYFASDMPGGFGGYDIYYCQKRNLNWDEPVNLGPAINTKGNEGYPFILNSKEFIFSSDGHPGLGLKDIFYSKMSDSAWLVPVALEAPINSEYDDFGFVSNNMINQGFFSSDRNNSVDIFKFQTNVPQIFYSETQVENRLCFLFTDSDGIDIDTTFLRYRWDFGDGNFKYGFQVKHCFNKNYKYNVKLEVIDKATDKTLFTKLSYLLDLPALEQPYILSPLYGVKNEILSFDGSTSYLPGYDIRDYFWDFGDGTKVSGKTVKHSFSHSGEYLIKLALNLKSSMSDNFEIMAVSRKIRIFDTDSESIYYSNQLELKHNDFPDIMKYKYANIRDLYSAESDFRNDAFFEIVIPSEEKLNQTNGYFSKLSGKYNINERISGENTYTYVIDRQVNFMAAYYSLNQLYGLGYNDAIIQLAVLTDPAQKELLNIIRSSNNSLDDFFDKGNNLTSNALIILNQVIKLLYKYPSYKLEIGVYTDNTGTSINNLNITKKQAQILNDYLISRGINFRRISAVGYGGTKPIALNNSEKGKKLNRRIEFNIVNQ